MGLGHSPQIVKNSLVLLLDAANKKSYPAAGSLYFDGSGDYLTILANSAFGFGTGDFTIEYWWYPTRNSGIEVVVDNRSSNTATPFTLGKAGNGAVLCYDGTIRTGGSMTLNAWNHVAWCRNGTSNVVYLNGASVISFTNGFDAGSSRNLTIGSNVDTNYENCQGYINDLRITKGIARYTGNFTPPQLINHLTDQYKSSVSLLLQTSAGIKDYSDNSFPITIVGNTTISTQTNVTTWIDLSGKGNNATLINGPAYNTSANGNFDFDGSNDYALVTLSPSLTLNSFTYNIWFKAHTLGGYKTLIDFPNDSNYFGFLNQTLISYGPTFNTGYVISTGVWYNACLSYTYGGAFKFYLNGVLIYTSSNINNSKTSSNISIGAGNGPNELFDGLISIVQLYNRGLSHLEVLQNFNALRGRYGI